MKKLSLLIMSLILLLVIPGIAAASWEVEAEAKLDGSQEVPPVMTEMTGQVDIEIEGGELEFKLKIDDNSHDIFAAHIHCAPPGVNGPIGVTLFSGSFTDDDGTLAKGTIMAPNAGNGCGWADLNDVAAAIANSAAYVNVHTTEASGGVPSGEIRGNLPGPGFEVESDTDLDGDQEVPPVMTEMTGEVEIKIEEGKLKFKLEVEDNSHEIFAAHIHCALPGANGPIGVTLFMGSFTDDEGTLAKGTILAPDAGNACGWADLNAAATAIANGGAYVNIHTTAASGGVPSGEIRGNLPGVSVEVESEADLDGNQEVPAVITEMTGEVEIKIEGGKLGFELKVEDNEHDIFAAHIHCAPPGVNGPVGVTLFMGSFTDDDGTLAEGTILAPDAGNGCGWADIDAVAAAIINGTAYVNVHTSAASGGVPSGEIRGDLTPE